MNSGWASDFSYSYFRKILQTVKSNFELHLLSQAPQIVGKLGRSKLILRHDVDVSLKRALRMARIEKDFGIRATYMVMTESSLYNIEDDTSRDILQKIMDMKHEIGLHIDPSLHKETGSIESRLDSACKKLENAIGQVSSFSFHKPPNNDLERCKHDLLISNRVNAYAEALTGRSWERYLADSSGCWKHGEPLAWLKEPNMPLRQLLIHPIWWGEEYMSREKRLRAFVLEETRINSRMLDYAKALRESIIETINVEFDL
ncbi:MAG: hypothetical protein NWE91_02745 [Candidatus Bathyarchaeota archaeon]|nr:hypothetical protein [Candidatus Bathyarchaeota archaeon]